jgi:hypothetical protein
MDSEIFVEDAVSALSADEHSAAVAPNRRGAKIQKIWLIDRRTDLRQVGIDDGRAGDVQTNCGLTYLQMFVSRPVARHCAG